LTVAPLKDLHGNVIGDVIGASKVARDITERRRTEEVLKQAHEELEQRVRERTTELSMANASTLDHALRLASNVRAGWRAPTP
jgi:C4-dicarboxylate-specific signal transduction histidine kinase